MSARSGEQSWRLRRRALAATIASAGFAVLAPLIGLGDSFGVVFDRYQSVLMPAQYTFAIWVVIHGALIAYAVAIGRHRQLAVAGHDHLAKLVIVESILAPVWIVGFRYDRIAWSVIVMFAMLVVAIAMFVAAHDLIRRERISPMWTLPFALLLGWLGVSTLVNLDVWLIAFGWRGGGIGETALAIGMIGFACVVAVAAGLRFADPVVPMVVAWALFGIWSGQRTLDLGVAFAAVVGGIACSIGAVLALIRSVIEARRDHAPVQLVRTPV
jgi:translocator protein